MKKCGVLPEFDIARPTAALAAEINGKRFYAAYAQNCSAKAFCKLLDPGALTFDLREDGNDFCGELPQELPPAGGNTAAKKGDLVFCGGKKIKLFCAGGETQGEVIAGFGEAAAGLADLLRGNAQLTLWNEWSE